MNESLEQIAAKEEIDKHFGPADEDYIIRRLVADTADNPAWADRQLRLWRPDHFQRTETKYLFAKLVEIHQKTGEVPTRELLRSAVIKHLTADDDYEAVLEVLDFEPKPRELIIVKQWMDQWRIERERKLWLGETVAAVKTGQLPQPFPVESEIAEAERFIGGQELWDLPDEVVHWLIQDVMVANQPCIVGGPSKTLKTMIALDAALSIQSGTKFLGRFQACKKNVGFISGESAAQDVKVHLKLMAIQRGLTGEALPWLYFKPVKLADSGIQAWIKAELIKNKIEVLMVDPLYLSLTAGSDVQASNIFEMGPLLASVNQLCKDVGCTLILLHHYSRKGGTNYKPPKLSDLSFAGCTEFARGWVLLNRAEEYKLDYQHQLWMATGGARRSELLRMHISEGGKDNPDWDVAFLPTDSPVAEKPLGKRAIQDRADKDILLKTGGVLTVNSVVGRLECGAPRAKKLLLEMAAEGEVEQADDVRTTDGRMVPSYRPVVSGMIPDDPTTGI